MKTIDLITKLERLAIQLRTYIISHLISRMNKFFANVKKSFLYRNLTGKDFTIKNKWNRFISNIYNSRISNWIKENLFSQPCLEVLFCAETGEYVSAITPNKEEGYTDYTIVDNMNYAFNFNQYGKIEKHFILKRINSESILSPRVFEFRKFIVIEKPNNENK